MQLADRLTAVSSSLPINGRRPGGRFSCAWAALSQGVAT
jgi:hypothetical protein